MRLNYKRLGDYINPVSGRNTDLQDLPLVGLSITKQFIPSIANTIGTDMSTYRIIKRNQFAYGPVTSRNGEKITIALFDELESGLISQAYIPFEVTDTKKLLPEYLMMWFRRPEFDRYARFMSHGSAREIFSWDDLCEVMLPLPSPAKQQEIVDEYHTVQNRINLNKKLIQKLEETAQAIYKQWFVDFEFPDKNGKPYKSSGGEMVESEFEEIPKGWEIKNLDTLAKITAGGDKPEIFSQNLTADCFIPIYSNTTVNEGLFGYTNKPTVLRKSITISARGAIIGYTLIRTNPFVPIVRLIVVTPLKGEFLNYLFYTVKKFSYTESGSAQGQLTVPEISGYKIISPTSVILEKYQDTSQVITDRLEYIKDENHKLSELKDLLLSKLATIED